MRTMKLPNFKITNYNRNSMTLKSTYHELSKFGMICYSLVLPTLQGSFFLLLVKSNSAWSLVYKSSSKNKKEKRLSQLN